MRPWREDTTAGRLGQAIDCDNAALDLRHRVLHGSLMKSVIAPALLSYSLIAAQALACGDDAILVFDGSTSMADHLWDAGGLTRIQNARTAVQRAMPQITPYRDVGLMIYGPGGRGSCDGIDLRFPPARDTAVEIIAEINALTPGGMTPIAQSVETAAKTLDYTQRPATIVVVTDGNETCGGTPCALGARLASQAHRLTIHVIGFQVVEDPFSWDSPEAETYQGTTVAKCLADSTGGMFVSTQTVDELVVALNQTLGCALIGRL